MTCFLGCCVQLLQILMEVTGVLFKNQHPFSFIDYYVSTKSAGGKEAWRMSSSAQSMMVSVSSVANAVFVFLWFP